MSERGRPDRRVCIERTKYNSREVNTILGNLKIHKAARLKRVTVKFEKI